MCWDWQNSKPDVYHITKEVFNDHFYSITDDFHALNSLPLHLHMDEKIEFADLDPG